MVGIVNEDCHRSQFIQSFSSNLSVDEDVAMLQLYLFARQPDNSFDCHPGWLVGVPNRNDFPSRRRYLYKSVPIQRDPLTRRAGQVRDVIVGKTTVGADNEAIHRQLSSRASERVPAILAGYHHMSAQTRFRHGVADDPRGPKLAVVIAARGQRGE